MPTRCYEKNGETCCKWGEHGHEYCGPDAKKKADRQGRAIKASQSRRQKQDSFMMMTRPQHSTQQGMLYNASLHTRYG